MGNNKCLNCNSDIENNFCSVCGQKTATHRFSLKHFVVHDFIHGVFHLDKGVLFTIKELFTRPGHSVRDYIQGKRVNYFNYFTLFLILLAINHFVQKYSSVSNIDLYGKEIVSGYMTLAEDYYKILKFISVPFWAYVLFLFFRKSKQNYLEMMVMGMYMMCGMLIIYLAFELLLVFCNNLNVLKIAKRIIDLFAAGYFFCFIYQYFSVFHYKKSSLIFRSFFCTILILLLQWFVLNTINNIGKMYFH